MSLMSWLFPGSKRSKSPPTTTESGSMRKSPRESVPGGSSAKRKI